MRALLLIGLAVAGLGGAAWYGGWLDGLRVPPATRAPAVGEPSWRDAGAAGYTDAQFAAAMEQTNPSGARVAGYVRGSDGFHSRLGPEGLLWRRHPVTGRWIPIDPGLDCALPHPDGHAGGVIAIPGGR